MRLPQFARDVRSALFEAIAKRRASRLKPDRAGVPHGLPGELIISLTSYPRRFPTLALTLACLCDQTMRADRIILWLAESDIEKLPSEIDCRMRQAGIEIRTCDDIGPHTKLIPTLEAFPDAFVITADDDIYYPRNWVWSLIEHFDGRSITCLIGAAVRNGRPDWFKRARNGDTDIIQYGVGGVLYPPGSLHEDVTDRRFLSLCPTNDDLWFYKMARRRVRKVGHKFTIINWRGTLEMALAIENDAGGNDRMFANLSNI
jgi:hypothetical protein